MFNPTVEVIAAQPKVLRRPDLSFDALLKHFPGLTAADAVCLSVAIQPEWLGAGAGLVAVAEVS